VDDGMGGFDVVRAGQKRCLVHNVEPHDMAQDHLANLENKPSDQVDPEPCLGVKMNSKRPGAWSSARPSLLAPARCVR